MDREYLNHKNRNFTNGFPDRNVCSLFIRVYGSTQRTEEYIFRIILPTIQMRWI